MGAAEAGPGSAADGGSFVPRDLVFVDLETTGGNAAYHRITEVGIVRMRDGAVVEEWTSLVNPECRIPSYIESFTGITNEMVAAAPRFADIAASVLERLRPPDLPTLFVAHNARFDYAFLRTEFRRLDVHFASQVLCTVKLSRRLFPQFHRHNLDAVMQRHGLECTARHRALGDARVLADFWCKLCRDLPPTTLDSAVRALVGANQLPAHLPPGLADELPEGSGVYRFFGEDDVLLYIGKSHALRTRILGHFAAEFTDAKAQKKARATHRIDWFETAGDLGAQLLESHWIKRQKPLFNKRLKDSSQSFTFQALDTLPGVRLVPVSEVAGGGLADCFGVFHTHKDGRKALTDIARAHSLCLKVLGLEESAGSCFAYQLGKCKGACVGKEPLMLHDIRLKMALSALKLKPWPFPGRVAIAEGRADLHVLDPWVYLGTARCDEELETLRVATADAAFDVDIYRILVRYLAKNAQVEWRDLRVTADQRGDW